MAPPARGIVRTRSALAAVGEVAHAGLVFISSCDEKNVSTTTVLQGEVEQRSDLRYMRVCAERCT